MAATKHGTLTYNRIEARPVMLKLKRPTRAGIGSVTDWPVIMIDPPTDEVIVGACYLERLYQVG